MTRPQAGRILPILCLLLSGPTLDGQTPPSGGIPRPDSVTQWGHRAGLPSTTVYAITQTSDGYLWLGTADGLVSFDGARFLQVPLSSNGPSSFGRVRALSSGEDKTLWVGTEDGKVVRIEGAVTRSISLHDPVMAIRQSANSGVDVETTHAVYRLAPATMEVISSCQTTGRGGDLCAEQFAEKAPASALAAAHLVATQVRAAVRDREGDVWLASKEHGVFRVSPGPPPLIPGKAHVGRGTVRLSPGNTTETLQAEQTSMVDGLSNDSVWALYEDREGNIWAGTQNGLNRLRYNRFSVVTRNDGLLSGNLNCIATGSDSVYAGSILGLNRLTTAGTLSTALHDNILTLATGTEGLLLAATPRGIVALKSSTQATRSEVLPLGVHAVQVSALTQAPGGELFFFDQAIGLYRWVSGRLAEKISLPPGHEEAISVLRADAHGGLWIGFVSGSIAYFDGHGFRFFTKADHLPGETPHFISIDRDGSIWIASEGGLARFSNGRFTAWSKADGLPGNRVLWAVPGVDGKLWLGFNIGIASIAITDLLSREARRDHRLHVDFYDDGDGLRSSPDLKGNDPVALLPDGHIWMMTGDGLATVDPAHMRTNRIPPLADITDLTADDRPIPLTESVLLPKRTRRVEIGYTGLSFSQTHKVKFRYKLNSFDTDWHDAENRRLATYTNLPPGHYTFEVMASNEDGIWSLQPDRLTFTVPAAFYQTRSFISLCVFTSLLAVALILRRRVRSATDKMRLLFDERLKERARLAQDLHDSLIQDVMGISLQLEIADELTPSGTLGKPVLNRALSLASSALAQGRSALTTLRATDLDLDQVIEAITQVSQRFAQPARLTSQLVTSAPALPLQAHIAEEIVQISREAVSNALHHTAGPVRLLFKQSHEAFQLSVEDNGPGIAPLVLQSGIPGHFGLTGMHERAARIAARLTIESSPAAGTTLRLSVPGKLAYREYDTIRNRWQRWKARLLPASLTDSPRDASKRPDLYE